MSDYQGAGPDGPQGQEGMGEGEPVRQRAEKMMPRAGEMAREAEQRTRSLREQVYRGVDQARRLAAGGLARAADTLRGSSPEGNTTARQFADNLERGATYLRQRELGDVQRDLRNLVNQNPGLALGAVFVAGWLLGRRMGRR